MKRKLLACPRPFEWPLGTQFAVRFGETLLQAKQAVLGVDAAPVIWFDPSGQATGLCADFRDARNRLVATVRDGVWRADVVEVQQVKVVDEHHQQFSLQVAAAKGTSGSRRVQLAFAVTPSTIHITRARFWVNGYRVVIDEGNLPNIGGGELVLATEDWAALWYYTPAYRGPRRSDVLMAMDLPRLDSPSGPPAGGEPSGAGKA